MFSTLLLDSTPSKVGTTHSSPLQSMHAMWTGAVFLSAAFMTHISFPQFNDGAVLYNHYQHSTSMMTSVAHHA
jgi:hypothetical protein